jgi:hypothetical protein
LSDTFYVQVDHRILKAIAIEHRKDVDSAVVAVLDEVMPSMTSSAGALSAHHEVSPSMADSGRNLFANHSTHEVGSSSSAGESEYQSLVNLYLVLKVFPCFFFPIFNSYLVFVLQNRCVEYVADSCIVFCIDNIPPLSFFWVLMSLMIWLKDPKTCIKLSFWLTAHLLVL